jgi:hypothetical protein
VLEHGGKGLEDLQFALARPGACHERVDVSG